MEQSKPSWVGIKTLEKRVETNRNPKPFVWTVNPNRIIDAVQRGKLVMETIHEYRSNLRVRHNDEK